MPLEISAAKEFANVRPMVPKSVAISGFTTADIWSEFAPPDYVVKRMVGQGELTILFGASGHFKSAIALDMALCVSSGREFHGVKTHQGAVLYLAGEGHLGIRKRVRAWLIKHEYDSTSDQPKLFVTNAGGNLIGDREQLRLTAAAAEIALGAPIQFVVIDTLAANFGPGEENSASDMAYALSSARDIVPGAAILLLHHIGHGDSRRERGSYALPASADYRLLASYDSSSKLIELTFEKVKDDATPQPMMFEWKSVELGWTDTDGEELTSIVLNKFDGAAPSNTPRVTGLGDHQERVLKALRNLLARQRKNLEQQGRDPKEARVLFDGFRNNVVNSGMDRRRFSQAVKTLQERCLVTMNGAFIEPSEALL